MFNGPFFVDGGDDCAWIDFIILPGFTSDSAGTGNDTLLFVSQADTAGRVDEMYSYEIEVTSSNEENQLSFMCHTAPEWLTLTDRNDGTAELTGMPDDNIYLGYHMVILCVTNGKSCAYQMFEILVQPKTGVEENISQVK